jgi:hypothetical protein
VSREWQRRRGRLMSTVDLAVSGVNRAKLCVSPRRHFVCLCRAIEVVLEAHMRWWLSCE